MTGLRKSTWLPVAALMMVFLAVMSCNGSSSTSVAHNCQGNLTVVEADVARRTPSPRQDYAVNQSYSWTEPPYGVEVSGTNGEAVMQIYDSSNVFLAKYTIYAADVANGDVSVSKWNGLSEITFNAGNFLVEDNNSQSICNLELFAGGVGINSVGTTYIITVRPAMDQVIVGVLDGVVEVTSQGQTVTLDAALPNEAMVVVTGGNFGPLLPIPDPGRLLQDVSSGLDVQLETDQPGGQTGPGGQTEPGDSGQLPGQGSLTLWADERLAPALEGIAAQFEKDTGMQLLIEAMPISDLRDKYFTALRAGSPPDLLTLQHTQIYDLVAGGDVLPLGIELSPRQVVPGTIQAFSYKGELFGVPYVFENLALVTNLEYVPEVPPSWSELSRYAAEIAKGREFFTGLMIPSDGYHFHPVLSAFGGYIFGTFPDGTFNAQDLGLISDGSLSAATWLEEMVSFQPVFIGNEDDALSYFQGGNAAMILTGPWSLPRLRETGIPFRVNGFPVEVQMSQPFLSASGFLISRATQNPEAAQNLLVNYLTTTEAMTAYSRLTGAPPARWDALESLEDADLRAFGIAGGSGIPIPNIPEMDAVWAPWTEAIQAIINQELSGPEAFRNANAIILKQIGQ